METITDLIDKIYAGTFPQATLSRLLADIFTARKAIKLPREAHWDEQDVVSGAKIDGTQPVKLDAWPFMWLHYYL